MEYADPEARRLELFAGADPANATIEINRSIAAFKSHGPPTNDVDAIHLASLYAVLAEAASELELDSDARDAATAGLTVLPKPEGAVFINLLYFQAANAYDPDDLDRALRKLADTHASVPLGSAAEACVLIAQGIQQHQIVREDLASISLTRAYRISLAPERVRQRALAAEGLSYVARSVGDYEQALLLNQEATAWYAQRKAVFEVATSRFVRGDILRFKRDFQAAVTEFEFSRQVSAQMNDPQGVAFADMRICDCKLEMGRLAEARAQCENALKAFDAKQSASVYKETLAYLADIDLRSGNPTRALARLNLALSEQGKDVLPRRVPHMYELRARAHGALGQFREATHDLNMFIERYRSINTAEREQQAAVLRAQFETDRQVERNTSLQRELQLQQRQLRTQNQHLSWLLIASAIGTVVVALLVYLLVINRRQRNALARLADLDALTQLPNRRRVSELAEHALALANQTNTALAVAVIDLDHFKSINDHYGHATGDLVLQRFAVTAQTTLRENDLFGRWGGEEFLAVLPNTTLDSANAILERLRTAAADIGPIESAPELRVSISVGIASNEGDRRTLDEIVAQADAALYQAKSHGRNAVHIAQDSYSMASTGVRRALRVAGIFMSTGRFPRYRANDRPK